MPFLRSCVVKTRCLLAWIFPVFVVQARTDGPLAVHDRLSITYLGIYFLFSISGYYEVKYSQIC